ncbi:hypothetical protein Micbo1qcDRAFT_186751 [Microdochium bolleyi]|uniref:FAD-binding PCMH-type domain-containing protein n=1 Tax=Microdochium bolleyi TaxID=196109 RepID=A0A136IJL4_9PEZI|nr:hypothetical protein Micbo1qcDRAFT_186751 [Microdochium bolleyi]
MLPEIALECITHTSVAATTLASWRLSSGRSLLATTDKMGSSQMLFTAGFWNPIPIVSVCHDPNYDQQACAGLKAKYSEPTSDVVTAIEFAKLENIWLVVRNTEHEFLGRSRGRGALAIWTRHLKAREIVPSYRSTLYTGAALKMGAGVQGLEAEESLAPYGSVAVGGLCPSVGIAGGFTAGGGHSPPESKFGMGAGQTLEFEVVTAAGRTVTASPTVNSDLYWARSGGGRGNAPIVGLFMMILRTGVQSQDFWAALRVFFVLMPELVDNGIGATFSLSADAFYLTPLAAHGTSPQWLSSTGYNAHWKAFVPLDPLVRTDKAAYELYLALPGTVVGAVKRTNAVNAVLPAWRRGVALLGLLLPWSDAPEDWTRLLEKQRWLRQDMRPLIEAVTTGSGTWMNDADYAQPKWREAFFGGRYNALKALKRTWDPESLF